MEVKQKSDVNKRLMREVQRMKREGQNREKMVQAAMRRVSECHESKSLLPYFCVVFVLFVFAVLMLFCSRSMNSDWIINHAARSGRVRVITAFMEKLLLFHVPS